MNHTQALARTPPRPARVAVLPPASFRTEWAKRPTDDVAIGIRLLSEQEKLTAQAEAFKTATQGGRTGEAASHRYLEEILVWAVAMAAVNPNDERRPWFADGNAEVKLALTPEAIRHLFDEMELAHVAASPTRAAATDEDLAQLAELLRSPDRLLDLHPAKALRVRKWLRFCLDELTAD
jgi:hypothetical protein